MVPEESLVSTNRPLIRTIAGNGGQTEPELGSGEWLDTVLAGDAMVFNVAEVRRIGMSSPVQAGILAIFERLRRVAGRAIVIMQ